MLNKLYQYSNKLNQDNTSFSPVVSVAPDVINSDTVEFDISSNLPNQTVLVNLQGNVTSGDMSNAAITNAPVSLDGAGNGTITYILDPESNFTNVNVSFSANVTSNAGTFLADSSNVIIGKVPAITATGGTITAPGDGTWLVHTFTANANLEITAVSNPGETLYAQVVSKGQPGEPGLWDQFARSGVGVRRRQYHGGRGGGAGTISQSNVSVSTLSVGNMSVTVGDTASRYSAFNNVYAIGSSDGDDIVYPDYGMIEFNTSNDGASSTRSQGTYTDVYFQQVSGFQPTPGQEARGNVVVGADGSITSIEFTIAGGGSIIRDGGNYDIGSVCELDDGDLGYVSGTKSNVVITATRVRSFDDIEYITSTTTVAGGNGGIGDPTDVTTYNTPTWPLSSAVGAGRILYSQAYDQGNAALYYKTGVPNTWTNFADVSVGPTDLVYSNDNFLSDPTASGLAIYGGNIAPSGGSVTDVWYSTKYFPRVEISGDSDMLGSKGSFTTGGTGGHLYYYQIPAITTPVVDQARTHILRVGGGGGGYEGNANWLSAGGVHNNPGDGTDVSNGDMGPFSTTRLINAGNGGAGLLSWDDYPTGNTTIFCHGGAGGAPDGDNRSGTVPTVTNKSGYGGDSANDYAGYDATQYGSGGGGAGARPPDVASENSDFSSDPYYTASGIIPPGGNAGPAVVKIAYRKNIRGFFPD